MTLLTVRIRWRLPPSTGGKFAEGGNEFTPPAALITDWSLMLDANDIEVDDVGGI